MNAQGDIEELLGTYFRGVYHGEILALQGIFHPEAELFGEVKGQPYRKSLAEYLQGVAGRKSPAELGEAFQMRSVGIDVVGAIAMAKLHCPMLGFNYIVFLTLLRSSDQWRIVSKTMTHVDVPVAQEGGQIMDRTLAQFPARSLYVEN